MTRVRNISNGPRGVYLAGLLVTVEVGKSTEADDWNPEWFSEGGDDNDTADVADLTIAELLDLAVAEGVIPSVGEFRESLELAITRRRAGELPDDDDDENLPATADDIRTAIALLDKANDEHWTAAGLPAVDAVAEIAAKPVSRKAIEEAAPEAKRATD